jgi:hypothetical protein
MNLNQSINRPTSPDPSIVGFVTIRFFLIIECAVVPFHKIRLEESTSSEQRTTSLGKCSLTNEIERPPLVAWWNVQKVSRHVGHNDNTLVLDGVGGR